MARFIAWLRNEPALIAAVVQAILAAVVAFGFTLTAGQAGGIEAAVSAVGALAVAVATRPFRVSALSAFITAVGTVLVAFAVPHVTSGEVSAVNAALTGIVMLLVSLRVQPVPPRGAGHVHAPPGSPRA